MPWVKAMNIIDVIRTQTASRGVSKALEDIASGTRTAMRYGTDESMVYLCESTRRPGREEIAELASGSSYGLKEFEVACRNPDFRMNCYTIRGKNFSVGIYESPDSPEQVGITHTVRRAEGMLELLNKIAELYGIGGANVNCQVPVDDIGLNGEKTPMPKPFQGYLSELGNF